MASKSGKKKRNSLLVLFACIVLCAGGYAMLSVYDAKKEKAEDQADTGKEISLFSAEKDSIIRMEFQNASGSMELLQKGGEWICKEDKKFPLNQDYADDMANELAGLAALRQIAENAEDLSEYGLDDPQMKVVFTSSDGENTLYLGDESPSSDGGNYAYLNGETTVYEIDSDVFTAFNYSKSQMMELEDAPEITASQVTKLEIKHSSGFDFTAVNEPIGDSSSWSIQAPYENPVVGDESGLTTFLGNYESISYEGAVEYSCKDFLKYGLDAKNPATALINVDYYELEESEDSDGSDGEDTEDQETTQERIDHQAEIIVGKQSEDGAYYVRVNGSSYVYLMGEDDVDNLLPDDAYAYVEPTISRISVDNMTKILYSANGVEYKITSKEKTTMNDDGEEETETDYFFNNKTMDISAFNAITITWSTLETSREMTAEEREQIDEADIVLTADIASRGNAQKVDFIRFNKSYYAVKDGENLLFLADKRDVDAFIEKLEAQDRE